MLSLRKIALLTALFSLSCSADHKQHKSDQLIPTAPTTTTQDINATVSYAPEEAVSLAQGFDALRESLKSANNEFCASTAPTTSTAGADAIDYPVYGVFAANEAVVLRATIQQFSGDLVSSKDLSPAEELKLARLLSERQADASLFDPLQTAIVVKLAKRHAVRTMSTYAMNQSILDRFVAMPENFFEKCGDRFVSGLSDGIQVSGVLRCKATTPDKKAKVVAEMSQLGSDLVGAATVQKQLNRLVALADGNCRFAVIGETGSIQLPELKLSTFVETTLTFLENTPPANSRPLNFETMPYSAILDTRLHDEVLARVDLEHSKPKRFIETQTKTIAAARNILEQALTSTNDDKTTVTTSFDTIAAAERAVRSCLDKLDDKTACQSTETASDSNPTLQ